METNEIKQLLQLYFNGENSFEDEKKLKTYFRSENVVVELEKYTALFEGISELTSEVDVSTIEGDVMDFILENEHQEKTKYRWLWKMVTGVAASIIIVLGGVLLYEQNQKPFDDTFENPEIAYAYAENTLQYISGKYNKGLAELANFKKLQTASEPFNKGVAPINEFFEGIEKINSNQIQ